MIDYITKNAVIECIDHWKKDMIEPLKAGRKIDDHWSYSLEWTDTREEVKCYTEDCPLCDLYFHNYDEDDGNCVGCPMGNCSYGSVWLAFRKNPCLETANGVVNKLESLLEKEQYDYE